MVCFIAFFKTFKIGLEEIYDEKNANNMNTENMLLHLLFSFISYLIGSIFFPFLIQSLVESYKEKINNYIKEFSSLLTVGTLLIFPLANSISSIILSLKYLNKNKSLFEDKFIYYPILWNKYSIFLLYYMTIKTDEENELISNSSLVSIYLYIIEKIISLLKKIFSLKGLMIIQLIPSIFSCFLYLYIIINLF